MTKETVSKIAILALPALLFTGLFFHHIGVTGTRHVHYVISGKSPYVNRLLPDSRVSISGDVASIIDEPVYFSVFAPPGNWETADVKLSFKAGERSILELGALKDLFAQAYDFRPLANTVVEALDGHGWAGKSSEKFSPDTKVFYREELLANPANFRDAELAVYKTSLPWLPPKNLVTSDEATSFDASVRAPFEFYVYLEDKGSRYLWLDYEDHNDVVGADSVTIRVTNEAGEAVYTRTFEDDGNTSDDGELGLPHEDETYLSPELDGLPEGVYRVSVAGTSDIWIRDVLTPTPYFAIKNSLTVQHPRTGAVSRTMGVGQILLNTNAKSITVEPLSAEALGDVTFGSTTVTLTTVGEKVQITSTGRDISPIIIPFGSGYGGELKITGEGFFTWATDPFFAPEPSGFNNFLTDPDAFKVLVARVPQVVEEDGWRVGEATFTLSELAKENGAYKFVLSAPLVDEAGGDVSVHAIDITFKKDPITLRGFLSSVKQFLYELF